jgi:hypothetical protein
MTERIYVWTKVEADELDQVDETLMDEGIKNEDGSMRYIICRADSIDAAERIITRLRRLYGDGNLYWDNY